MHACTHPPGGYPQSARHSWPVARRSWRRGTPRQDDTCRGAEAEDTTGDVAHTE